MLPCRRIHHRGARLAGHFRYYSSPPASPYTLQNIRAFPFKLSPDDAQRHLSPFAAVLRGEKLLESMASRLFPSLGFEPIQPLRLTPVYFPAWILDAEIQGEVTYKGDDRQASVQIHDVYIPGSDYKVLSSAPLAPAVDPDLRETVSFSEDLLRQFDLDIACIPYNISPFSVLDLAHHLLYPEATITQDFRFTPSSLTPTLLAAYPVLIPLYLAQYEYDTGIGKGYHTIFIEAFGKEGNVWSEAYGQHLSFQRFLFNRICISLGTFNAKSNDIVVNLGYPKRFVETLGCSLSPHQELGQVIREYLENALHLPSTPTALAAASVNDLGSLVGDKRIREFTIEERTPIITWLKVGAELMMVERMHEAMSKAREGGRVLGSGARGGDKISFVDGAIQHLVDKSAALHMARRKAKPTWAKSEEELLEEKSEAKTSEPTESKTDKDSES